MAGLSNMMQKGFKAGAAIPARTLVKFGADDASVVPATASTDAIIGVSNELAAAIGEPVDIVLLGIPEVVLGGNVTRGDPLTSDANGHAVTAAPAAGVNARIIGFALVSGVANDIAPAFLNQGRIQG